MEQFRQIGVKSTAAVVFMIAIWLVAHGREIRSVSRQEMNRQADLVVIAKPVSSKDTTERSMLTDIYPNTVSVIKLPTRWDCTVLQGDEVKLVPHGLKRPLFEFIASNTNVSFVKDPDAPKGTKNPIIPLCFFRQTEKAEIMKVIETESSLSWNIPVYFGEIDEFVVVTSPAYVNGGVFAPEARRALRPMWQLLRDIIPNKEKSEVDELAADN
jgi:hypothetical protein